MINTAGGPSIPLNAAAVALDALHSMYGISLP
jgi:hypothetical protein